MHAADPHVELVSVATPELAPIIQAGFPFDDEVVDVVRTAVAPLREAGVDTVILGCTHYPLIRPMLQRMLGRGVAIVTSGAALARQVEHALGSRGLASTREGEGDYRFLSTGDPEAFRMLGTRFLQLPLGTVEQVHLPIGATAMSAAARALGRARRRRTAPRRHPARLRRHRDRLGADRLRRHARHLHRVDPGGRAALAHRLGAGLGDGGVRDAPRLDR